MDNLLEIFSGFFQAELAYIYGDLFKFSHGYLPSVLAEWQFFIWDFFGVACNYQG